MQPDFTHPIRVGLCLSGKINFAKSAAKPLNQAAIALSFEKTLAKDSVLFAAFLLTARLCAMQIGCGLKIVGALGESFCSLFHALWLTRDSFIENTPVWILVDVQQVGSKTDRAHETTLPHDEPQGQEQ